MVFLKIVQKAKKLIVLASAAALFTAHFAESKKEEIKSLGHPNKRQFADTANYRLFDTTFGSENKVVRLKAKISGSIQEENLDVKLTEFSVKHTILYKYNQIYYFQDFLGIGLPDSWSLSFDSTTKSLTLTELNTQKTYLITFPSIPSTIKFPILEDFKQPNQTKETNQTKEIEFSIEKLNTDSYKIIIRIYFDYNN
ncbi:MAG: hypothetical protein N3D10_03875 [Candidatus Micrarchaeota archaeon]|nr:hypothetical protein [Candidatus Micrarchaeota archaeon]